MLLASSHIPPSYYTAGVNFNLLTFQTFYSCIPQNVELFSETILGGVSFDAFSLRWARFRVF